MLKKYINNSVAELRVIETIKRMEKCIFKRQILFVAFVLLGCLMTYAADDDLITRQIKLKLEKAGTLPDKISSTKKNKITNLKIIGDINGTDLRFIREMAGGDCYGNPTDGHLTSLDLYEANIVEGGDYYYHNVERPFYCKANAIGYCAFWGCSGLTSVTIPSSVTEIGPFAFSDCRSLTSVPIPSSITKIGDNAFSGCSGLTSVTIPSSVTEIGSSAFSDCRGLTSVTVPSSVTKIGDNTFSGCSGLTSVYVSWKTPLLNGADKFKDVDKQSCTLYVPQDTSGEYYLSEWGDYFDNIVEYDVTGINKVKSSANVTELSRYSVNGHRLDSPTKGLNIVKYSDGSVRKIAVQ